VNLLQNVKIGAGYKNDVPTGKLPLMKPSTQVVWFKRDLRLEDHLPLIEAAQLGNVLPLYIIEPELWQQPDSSRRHWHFIHDSLRDLDQALSLYGGSLVVCIGNVLSVLEDLRQKLGHFSLWSHEETGNAWSFKRDIAVAKWCRNHMIIWHELPAHGVIRRLQSRDGWSKLRDLRMAETLIPKPAALHFIQDITGDKIPSKDHPLFGESISGTTQPGGRKHGLNVLNSFLKERGRKYMLTISKPGVSAHHCSRLSAHIAYGTVSIREIEQATKNKIKLLQDSDDQEAKYFKNNLSAFLSRLAWRCHFVQKLEQQPNIETHCMHPAFEGMREPHFREEYFQAWKYGQTGYPLVDACMRSLIENGWITFRMRAMLVSFASYHLWLDWRQTAPYLAKLFTDYEPGIHYSQFQMQSGVTGINAIRMYNPIKQSLDHDPEGAFILRYVPELKEVPKGFIHEPWRLNEKVPNYPRPIVEHKVAIQYAREQISHRRKEAGFRKKAKDTHAKLGSRNRQRKTSKKSYVDKKQMTLNFE
jgi:deoxyribodipyrimidine photo-lyase